MFLAIAARSGQMLCDARACSPKTGFVDRHLTAQDILERREFGGQRISLTSRIAELTANHWFVDLLESEHPDQALLTLP